MIRVGLTPAHPLRIAHAATDRMKADESCMGSFLPPTSAAPAPARAQREIASSRGGADVFATDVAPDFSGPEENVAMICAARNGADGFRVEAWAEGRERREDGADDRQRPTNSESATVRREPVVRAVSDGAAASNGWLLAEKSSGDPSRQKQPLSMQQFLNLRSEPHGHGSLRPSFSRSSFSP